MIVSVTRDDLREEFAMADEAFALSPISARAALPSDEDYAAISEAFMETSRGRWFLGEYAKRNRNADTSMVLDAVARIEESLVAQRQAADAETGLAEALAAIRSTVEAAQASAIEALDGLALDERLAPVRKGARVIREIAWRLREIGADSRICDLIDSQLSAIEAGAARISSSGARAALSAAFASIADRLAEFGDDGDAFQEAARAPPAAPSPPPSDETAAAVMQRVQAAPATEASEVPDAVQATAAEAAQPEVEPAEMTDAAADAHDEAVLDMIALEMGAPDAFDGDDMAGVIVEEAHIAEPAPAEPDMVAEAVEPVSAPAEPPAELAPSPAPQVQPKPAIELSLGSSIIASGIVRRPAAAADPLAPIRRMSQAEKIAFFS
jgi:hypothetical protein